MCEKAFFVKIYPFISALLDKGVLRKAKVKPKGDNRGQQWKHIKKKKIKISYCESPNKCSTIINILKKLVILMPTVTASLGHIMEGGVMGGNLIIIR